MRLSLLVPAFCVFSLAAHATIMGNTIQVTQTIGGTSTGQTNTFVVPGSNQGAQQNTQYSVTATSVDFSFTQYQILDTEFTFTDMTGPTNISSITLDPSSADPTGLVITPGTSSNGFTFTLEGPVSPSDTINFDLNYAPSSVTPEPSSFALLGTGILGVAGVIRRRLA